MQQKTESKRRSGAQAVVLSLIALGAGLGACGKKQDAGAEASPSAASPVIEIDGSSTVFPISEAVAEEFQKKNSVRVTVSESGTGGGFKKFCAGETVVQDASRPITAAELKLCAEKGIAFIELPVAYDGIAVVVNPANTWVDKLTVAELKKIWEPAAQGQILKWNQVREGWPDAKLTLAGPGVASGTYDYFTEVIVGKAHSSRGDFQSSEDDNVLVNAVKTDKDALGYFGYAYYAENQAALKLVPIQDGDHPAVTPSPATIGDGSYRPLSRPVFIYVSASAAKQPGVKSFVEFYLDRASALVREVQYVPLTEKAYSLARERFQKGVTGTSFGGPDAVVGASVEDVLAGKASPAPAPAPTPAEAPAAPAAPHP